MSKNTPNTQTTRSARLIAIVALLAALVATGGAVSSPAGALLAGDPPRCCK